MTIGRPALIAIGGFPGTGKTAIGERLARNFCLARLSGDVFGNSIRKSLDGAVRGDLAFRAGYDLMFKLCAELLGGGVSVLIDCSLGWELQWCALDGIRDQSTSLVWIPIILRCSQEVCLQRLQHRHVEEPSTHPPAATFIERNHQLDGLWRYLDALDRPDAHSIDASDSLDAVYEAVLRDVEPQLHTPDAR